MFFWDKNNNWNAWSRITFMPDEWDVSKRQYLAIDKNNKLTTTKEKLKALYFQYNDKDSTIMVRAGRNANEAFESQKYQVTTQQVKKGAEIEAIPIADNDYFESDRPDDPNNRWKMDYCYWEAKPNPEAANEGIPQKLMIKPFPDDYYMTGSRDYNPAGELEDDETEEGAEDAVVGNSTGG